MAQYYGDFKEDATVNIYFATADGSGGAVAPSSAFEAADVAIYKNASATQKASTNGVTMTSPFDSITGLHNITIDTSNDTGDSGFWEVGNDYTVILNPDETIDSQTVVDSLVTFSIENRFKPVDAPEKNVALVGVPFNLVDSTDHVTAETGASVTVNVSKDGAAYASGAGTLREIGSGSYEYDATQSEMNADRIRFRFTASGVDPVEVYIKTITQ